MLLHHSGKTEPRESCLSPSSAIAFSLKSESLSTALDWEVHYYTKNIADFNNATRHLTRQERSIYSDLLELQYDLETPLPDDLDWICRRIIATSEQERTDVERMLNEFFDYVQGWSNARCEAEIEAYKSKREKAIKAGKASGIARKRNKKPNKNNNSANTQTNRTYVERTLNGCSTDVEPTNNHKPLTNITSENKFSADDLRFARYAFSKIKQVAPKQREPNFEKWADTVRLMREQDGLTIGEIVEVFDFANQDGFWKTNILSVDKLRKQFPTLHAKIASADNQQEKQYEPEL